MKLISKNGSKSPNQKIDQNTTPEEPAQILEQTPVPEKAKQNTAQPEAQQAPTQPETEQKAKLPTTPEITEYPEATLSEKQLAALQKVIGPAAEHKSSAQKDIGQGDAKNPKKGSKKKKKQHDPLEKAGERSVVKTVFLVFFLILFLAGAGLSGWYYWWTTYATFDYELTQVVILEGDSIKADEFLFPGEEMRGMSAVIREPDFKPNAGFQYVPLTLSLGLRTVDTAAILYVLTPVEQVEHEFAVAGTILRPVDFLSNVSAVSGVDFTIRFTDDPFPLEEYPVGEFTLHLALNDTPFEVTLVIVDTTPPTATPVDVTIQIGDEVLPEEFVTDIYDASPIASITFVDAPDVRAPQTQTVTVAIEDAHGNIGTFEAELSMLLNQMPPVIDTLTDTIESEVGTTISYLDDVSAIDDFGREIEVHVDDTEVDPNTEGTYTAIFWAEDYSGNRTEVEMTIHVIGVNPERVVEMVGEQLARIIRDNMSQVEKARAINDWIRWSVQKSDTESPSQSVLAGAYRALDERRGDFHAFYSLSELMLTRAGIPNMRIDRISDAATPHSWNLINPDERGWHHFDSFPTGLGLGGGQMSMFTDAQAQSMARRIGTDNYYTYDPEFYPDIVKE